MFATISYNASDPDDEIRVVPASAQYFGGGRPARHACTECRAKKVKCTGEKTGCAKCRANKIQCVYPSSSERGARGRRRTTSTTSVPARHNTSNSITSNPAQSNSKKKAGDKDGSASPCKSGTRPSSYIDSGASSVASPLEMDLDFKDPLLSSSLPLPSPGHDSFSSIPDLPYDFMPDLDAANLADYSLLTNQSPSLFDLNTGELSLDNLTMGDDFGYNLERMRSPVMHHFGDLNLMTPPSTASMTPSQGSDTPQLRHPTPPRSSASAKNLFFDIQNSIGDNQPCTCSQSAMHMLEDLELKDYNNIELSTDAVLNNQKTALTQFHTWLGCERCPTPMATSMLLALIIERLALYLEKGVAHYMRELQKGIKEDKNAYAGPRVVGEYQIESRHEWGQVMRVLLLIRSRELESAVARLKECSMLDSMLSGTERRTRRIISELTSWEG